MTHDPGLHDIRYPVRPPTCNRPKALLSHFADHRAVWHVGRHGNDHDDDVPARAIG